MDCCNYVQPYARRGHFYQQQQFCYENANAYTLYNDTVPIASSIEANTRYNRLPFAYHTDYVYNPKEARLRKAMREQSREMSRQSILQSAVASAVRTASPLNVNTSKNMNFSHHPSAGSTSVLGAGATISTLPENSSNDNYDRAVNPWISLGHAAPIGLMKPILLSRGIPAHQGMADKSNEMLRIEVDCVNGHAFSNSSTSSYAGDFVQHNTNADTVSGQPSSDYCIIAEFTEGQKWHPYQNVPNSYHGGGTPISKIATLHGNIPNAASHTHGAWTQFCGLPLPTSTTQSAMLRSPRHMLFLQDHRSEQRNFIDEAHHNSNKVEIHDEEKCTENDGRWMHGTSNELSSSSTLQPGRRLHTDLSSEQQDDQMHLQVRMQSRTYSQKPFMQTYTECNSYQANQLKSDEWSKENFCCKQRLPGFHQAFGSTEIGRFSRSQFFTSMVGSDSDNSVSNNSSNNNNNNNNNNGSCHVSGTSTFGPTADGASVGNFTLAAHYNEVRNTPASRWHNPYVGVIGSEI